MKKKNFFLIAIMAMFVFVLTISPQLVSQASSTNRGNIVLLNIANLQDPCNNAACPSSSIKKDGADSNTNLELNDYALIYLDSLSPTCAATAACVLQQKLDAINLSHCDPNNSMSPPCVDDYDRSGGKVHPFQRWIAGAMVAHIYTAAIELKHKGYITLNSPLDKLLQNLVRDNYKHIAYKQDIHCGSSDNSCMEDYALTATGFAWLAAYEKEIRGNMDDFQNYASKAQVAINLAFEPISSSSSGSICYYVIDSIPVRCNGNETGEPNKIIGADHNQENPPYGIGVMTGIASAIAGLNAAGYPFMFTDGQKQIALALFKHGQEKISPQGNFKVDCINFSNPSGDKVPCDDSRNTPGYKPTDFPLKGFYEALTISPIAPNGFEFCQFGVNRFSNNRSDFFGPNRKVFYESLIQRYWPPSCSTTSPTTYEGNHDIADCDVIFGWGWDSSRPNDPVNVEIYDGSNPTPLAVVPADLFRQDLLNANIGNGHHGFSFPTPSSLKNGQQHSIRVKIQIPNSGVGVELYNTPKVITCNIPRSTIQGFKIDENNNQFYNPGATIEVGGITYGPSVNPYIFNGNSGSFVVTSSVPPGYTVSYSLCNNCISHPLESFVDGNTAFVNTPADGYSDLWWKYTRICTYSISPTSETFFFDGGNGNVNVTANAGCSWNTSSSVSWISITNGSTGTGTGTVSYSVAPNSGNTRAGILTIAGQLLNITQYAGCLSSYSITPTNQTFTSNGGNSTVSVIVNPNNTDCTWNASSNASWISITNGNSGGGAGTVSYSVAPNIGAGPRTGTLTIAGQTFTVSQGLSCSYSISPINQLIPANGGSGNVTVTTNSGCPWTATSNISWISIISGSSSNGSGTVSYSVVPNSSTGSRSGTMTIASQTFTVTQNGQSPPVCTYSISPTSTTFPANGANDTVTVTTNSGCPWTATSNISWISIISGSSGNGSGTVSYSVAPNSSTSSRSGTMTIASQTFTVTQNGQSPPVCTYSISPTSYAVNINGGNGLINVYTSPNDHSCSWIATSNVAWISIIKSDIGSGNGIVEYSVTANDSGSSRIGTITVAHQTFTVKQDSTMPPDAALFVSQSVPGNIGTQVVTVSIRMRNTGTTTWTSDAGYRLQSENPTRNRIWGRSTVPLPFLVAPNSEVTFTFTVTVPYPTGSYNFQWRVSKDGNGFGDFTRNIEVYVPQ